MFAPKPNLRQDWDNQSFNAESEDQLTTYPDGRDASATETSRFEIIRFTRKWLRLFKEFLLDLGFRYAYTWTIELVVRLIRGAPIRDYSQISPQLFIGGQHRKRGWPTLKSWGITAVLNLRSRFDDKKAGIASNRYLHLSTRDGTPPTLDQLKEGVAFMKEEIDRGGAIYVHCEAGVGRSATMVAAYLIEVGEMTPTQAWAKIRSVRPFIRPTSSQKMQIERFAKRVHAMQ